MQLRLSEEATQDIYELHIYGARTFGTTQADRYVDELGSIMAFLAEYPLMARERTETRPPVRLYPFRGHNVVYRLLGDEMVVVRVLHHKANWMSLL
jgi:toxin ParE1/3/4